MPFILLENISYAFSMNYNLYIDLRYEYTIYIHLAGQLIFDLWSFKYLLLNKEIF